MLNINKCTGLWILKFRLVINKLDYILLFNSDSKSKHFIVSWSGKAKYWTNVEQFEKSCKIWNEKQIIIIKSLFGSFSDLLSKFF